VDPIDGTLNFAQGLPFWSVSIAREVDGELTLGVVLDVPNGDLYTAVKGGGAYRNGRPIHVSDTARPIEAIVATGFSYDASEKVRNIQQLEYVAPQLRGLRRFGSAALDLCYVACGQLDGYWELTLNAWDVAAGALIVREAGGTVSELDGSPMRLDTGAYLASNGRLHGSLVELLKAL
jgi:myo-inositol-1(or 4)-monophosphatase